MDGPIVGLDCTGPDGRTTSGPGGVLAVRPGDHVTLSIGALILGRAAATATMTSLDLDSTGTPARPGPRATNVARLLHSLGTDRDLVNGIVVLDRHRAAASQFAGRIDFDLDPVEFGRDPAVRHLVEQLGVELRSDLVAANHLRRSAHGLKKLSDVVVPLRDDGHLLADVIRPLRGDPVPAILRLGPYGRGFGFGRVVDDSERQRSEQREHAWFTDRASAIGMRAHGENLTAVDAFTWVPRGYAVVRIDVRGIGGAPGPLQPFSRQEAIDYYDAIEWAAAQDWCNGAVGLAGASYAATTQWNVARLRPPSLRAMIPWAGDVDSYRDLAYPGGIFHEGYRTWWWDFVTANVTPGEQPTDFLQTLRDHPFDDPDFYGPDGDGPVSADLAAIDIPFLTSVSQNATLHARGGFEAFRESPSPDKRLLVVDGYYYPFFYRHCLDDLFDFFDHWLKGQPSRAEPDNPVRYSLLTGHGRFEWRQAPTWPPPGVEPLVLHLDASSWEPRSTGVATLGEAPTTDGSACYPADDRQPSTAGATFVSPPLESDLTLVGHATAYLTMESSSRDADVFVSVRAIDEHGLEIPYHVGGNPRCPVSWGCLKASHRALDDERTLPERPWHRHGSDDVIPLQPGVPTELIVEMMAATAKIPAGCRVRVDVQPVEGLGGFEDTTRGAVNPARAYDASYHASAVNTLHTGPRHPSMIVLPRLAANDAQPTEPITSGAARTSRWPAAAGHL